MSIEREAIKGASWLASFKFLSQVFSWLVTILVARILVPDDYGLMEMATVFTGIAMLFSELGLGSAIIQNPEVTQRELSSIFWFVTLFGIVLGLGCFLVAYPTAWVFHEPRVIPITQTVSVLFVLGSVQIVPLNLMKKDLQFKKIGFIEMTGVFVSGTFMYIAAKLGAGVWTLLWGHIVRSATIMIMAFIIVNWLPMLHIQFFEVKNYLKFGIMVSVGNSLYYVYSKSDKFFAGRVWNSTLLGYYSFALQLAQIPTEKIVVLINQVSYPAFSKLQFDKIKFTNFYNNIIRITAAIIFPIFVGGYLVGGDIIKVLLNEKWYPIIPLFKYLCLAQITVSLNAINNFVHTSQGRPQWALWYNAIMTLFLPVSFYIAVRYGINAILVPWFTTYLLISAFWIYFTLIKIGIPFKSYFRNLIKPIVGSALISISVIAIQYLSGKTSIGISPKIMLISEIGIGGIVYLTYLFIFDRNIFNSLRRLIHE